MFARSTASNRGSTSHRLTRFDVSPLVSSLVSGDTRQPGLSGDGLSSHLSCIVQDEATPGGRRVQTTQIYQGTNQIQRIVIAKRLFG